MKLAGSQLLSTMLAMATTFLALSIMVQVIQEIYKYLTKSKSRLYTQFLADSLGSWASQLLRPEVVPQYLVRGPLQIWRSRPGGILLPLDEPALKQGLEKVSPPRIRQVLRALEFEVALQENGTAPASPSWQALLENLALVERGTPGYWPTLEIVRFLVRWHHVWDEDRHAGSESRAIGPIVPPADVTLFDASKLFTAFRGQFLQQVDEAVAQYPQIQKNFEYAYSRRNMRQTFVFGLAIAVFFNLPFQKIYQESRKLSPAEAANIAEQTIELYDRLREEQQLSDSDAVDLEEQLANLKEVQTTSGLDVDFAPDWSQIRGAIDLPRSEQGTYLFGCLLTTLLVTFGAPFWNDVSSALLRIQKSRGSGKSGKKQEGDQ